MSVFPTSTFEPLERLHLVQQSITSGANSPISPACLYGMHRDKFLYTVGSCNMMEGAGFSEALFTAYMRNVLICGIFNGAISSSGYSIQLQTVGLSVKHAFEVMWKWL